MGLDLSHGGHLTHGSKVSFSGQIYNSATFKVKKESGLVDFDDLLKKEFDTFREHGEPHPIFKEYNLPYL